MSFFRLGCIELKGSFGPQPHFLNSHMSVLRSAQLNKLFGFRLRIYIRPERHFHHRSSLLEETVGNWKRQLTAGRDSKMTAFSWHHSWSKTNKTRFLSKHILIFRVVRCSRESVISAGITPQDCFRNSHHHPLLVVWNLKEYVFFFVLWLPRKGNGAHSHTRFNSGQPDVLRKIYSRTVSEQFQDNLESQIELPCPIKLSMFSNWMIFTFCLSESARWWNLAI